MIDRRVAGLAWSFSVGRVSIILTIGALIVWASSILHAEFDVGFYGLIAGFPVAFFVALGILTTASAILWTSKENHGTLLFLQLCLLIAAIWSAPVIVGGAQPFASDAYADLGYIEYITRHGHLDPADVWQHNWPVAWIFWAALTHIFGLSVDDLASLIPWIPLLWQLMLLPPLFVFFRNTIGSKHVNCSWAAVWLFYLGNWFETQNTGGQAFGVFFFFSMLAVLSMPSFVKQAFTSTGHTVSAVVILAASAVAHLLGSLVTLAGVAGLWLSRRVKVPNMVALAVLFIGAWSIFGAMAYFERRLPALLEAGLRLDLATERGVLNPLSGNESHASVALVRILFSGLLLALGILGGLVGWKLRNNRYADITVLAIMVGCSLVALVVGAGYKHELYQRFFTFLLPAIAYFVVKTLLLRPTRIIVYIALLVALPLTFIAKYGNQAMDYLSPSYLSGAVFFHEHTIDGYITAELPVGRMKNYEKYHFRPAFSELQWNDGGLYDTDVPVDKTHYITVSDHDREYHAFLMGDPQLIDGVQGALNDAPNCDLVYCCADFRLYASGAR